MVKRKYRMEGHFGGMGDLPEAMRGDMQPENLSLLAIHQVLQIRVVAARTLSQRLQTLGGRGFHGLMIGECDVVQRIRRCFVWIPAEIQFLSVGTPEWIGRGGAYPFGVAHDLFDGEAIERLGVQAGAEAQPEQEEIPCFHSRPVWHQI